MSQSFGNRFRLILAVIGLISLGVIAVLLSPVTIPEPKSNRRIKPEAVKVILDVEYGRVGGSPLRLDVYQPRSASVSLQPAVLLIHGGGWVEGDKAGERDLAAFLVPQGFVAFAINYRLAVNDQRRYPAAVLDVRRAARWVRIHAREFGADPTRLGVVGVSAGGHLAALLGTTDLEDPDDPNSGHASSRVDCVVDTSGPTDFTDDANPPTGPSIARVIPMFFGKPRGEIPRAYHDASPALLVDSKTVPTLIVHGTLDDIVPIEQSRRFERALEVAKVESRLVELEGEGHGFVQPGNLERWLDETGRFLVDHLKP